MPSTWLVTLDLDPSTFDRLDALRRCYFPRERNVVPAHVSLFHALPGEQSAVIRAALGEATIARVALPVRFTTLRRLARGMAVAVEAPGLAAVHGQLARSFANWLTPQDRQPFRPHVTLMNKAEPHHAALAFAELSASWVSHEGTGDGLRLWEYLGGPWRLVERFPFASD